MERIIRFIDLILLSVILLTGCNATQAFIDNSQIGDEVRGQIKRYYDSLQESNEHSVIFNRAMMTLDKKNLSEVSHSNIGQYLFSKGYRVEAKGEPLFKEFQEPYAVYSIDVEVDYPKDSLLKGKLIQTTETVWVNVEKRLISKIESKDVFISARAYEYEFLNN